MISIPMLAWCGGVQKMTPLPLPPVPPSAQPTPQPSSATAAAVNNTALQSNGVPASQSYPTNAIAYKGHHFFCFPDKTSWEDAKTACLAKGGHLAVFARNEWAYDASDAQKGVATDPNWKVMAGISGWIGYSEFYTKIGYCEAGTPNPQLQGFSNPAHKPSPNEQKSAAWLSKRQASMRPFKPTKGNSLDLRSDAETKPYICEWDK